MARGGGSVFKKPDTAFWHCSYYDVRGKQIRESTGETDEKKARKFLKNKVEEIIAAKRGGPAFVGPAERRVIVDELLDALERSYRIDGKDSAQFKSHLKMIRAHFGDLRAVNVTSDAIDVFIETKLEEEYKPATINRSTQLLGQAFKLAIKNKKLNGAPSIRHLSEKDNVRQGFFGVLEFQAVESNLPADLKDFARFGYVTGWRRGEIASLRWEDVDGDVIRLRGKNAKNGEGRQVTVDGELAELMERREKARSVKTETGVMKSDLIFHRGGSPIVDFRKAWATACKMAGCPGRLFHDLRRSAVRNMTRAGVSQTVAMEISGHKTDSMFRRYNISSEADLRDAMQRAETYRITAAEAEAKRQPAAKSDMVQ